ncbi:MAG: hypothetical protein IKU70_05790 [Clostridia bacterium]|nr:hypothetical protein [Clostridia bacterium]
MEEMFRISVRELVAFSCFAPDIMPATDAEALLTGAQAHRARQAEYEGQTEQTIRHVYELNGASVQVYGRMDAFVDGDIPFVEEIKLCRAMPTEARIEHRAQAVCYAAMLAEEQECPAVRISICYVNDEGIVQRSFEEEMTAEALRAEIHALLAPFVRFAIREAEHRAARDESLRALPFPFDSYRKGQRELAAQVYTAIQRKKRLFASLPTGTGKSAAVLYPALKALGNSLTERVIYLTARNTARQSPLNALRRMHERGMQARCCVLTAREKLCPAPTRCHPDDCPRAKGHFLRQGEAIDALLASGITVWDDGVIIAFANRYEICPFEFALALSEIADVLLMDLNYAFDPFAQLKRLFQRQKNFTLLADEAHHAVERVRESLSGVLDSHELGRIRTEYGKGYGRKNGVYRSLTTLIHALRALECPTGETTLKEAPEGIAAKTQIVLDEAIAALPAAGAGMQELIRICLPYLYAQEHLDEDYAVLLEKHGKERALTLYCLLPGREIGRVTKGLRGSVFFSATLNPLPAMKQLLGGSEDDACFALPSPFPPARLQVIRRNISTRYEKREESAAQIADCIHELLEHHPGNTLVFFPSYAYLNLVSGHLDTDRLPELWVQKRDMEETDRDAFLSAFENAKLPRLGLCVLGGLFSEGIDLPGKQLVNVVVVGVGLPVPSAKLNAVRACYQRHFGDGFAYACRIPGMQKVLQAAGRVIRSETDSGIVMLLDDRYQQWEYAAMLPQEWSVSGKSVACAAARLEECK